MYYNQISQPDGTVSIGINHEENRPEPFDIENVNTNQLESNSGIQTRHSSYSTILETRYKFHFVWEFFNYLMWFLSFMYIIDEVNTVTIFNGISSTMSIISMTQDRIIFVLSHSFYISFATIYTTSMGIFDYLIYYILYNFVNWGTIITLVITNSNIYLNRYEENGHVDN